jgi:glutamine---fructose-6-phosphate transaminase (isomerizing)
MRERIVYHMLDYIHEEPDALARTYTEADAPLRALVEDIQTGRWERLVLLGVGSSYTAALMALPTLRVHSPIPIELIPSTELVYYRDHLVNPRTVVVSISRSGERGWVVEAQRTARSAGALTVAMTGVRDSLLATEAQLLLPTAEGREITFSKTKSVITCAGLLMRFALLLASDGDSAAARRLALLDAAPQRIETTLRMVEPSIRAIVPQLATIEHVYLCGSGSNHGVALEGAIKIQETSFVPAKAEDTGNCLHGVLGTTDAKWLVIALVTRADEDVSNAVLQLAGVAGARRLAVADGDLPDHLAEHVVNVPQPVDPLLAGLLYLPPLQLLTYYLTLARGRDPDAPSYMDAQLAAMLPTGRQEPELRTPTPGSAATAG